MDFMVGYPPWAKLITIFIMGVSFIVFSFFGAIFSVMLGAPDWAAICIGLLSGTLITYEIMCGREV